MILPWRNLYDLVLPHLPGCPFPAVEVALRQAAISFCEQSLAWRHDHPEVTVVAGKAAYDFAPPPEAVVHAIMHARFNGRQIEAQAGDPGAHVTGWPDQAGTPRYVVGGAMTFTLVPVPDRQGTLALAVSLKPSPVATGIAREIFDEYRDAIAHGALARLMLSPKKPYADASRAAYHSHQFIIGAASAGIRQARNYTRAPLVTSILRRG
jgi:hypothetical protein